MKGKILIFSVAALVAVSARAQGPCDIYAEGGSPCVAAHSSTRALYAAYRGPLYQVLRQSDGRTLDIGVVKPSAGDRGGYADAAAQDAFCANTTCWITMLYDQSGHGNHLVQPPRGGFGGPALGGFNNLPVADMAPVTLMGHKVYGVFIAPGMGLRQNDARGTAVDDQAEGQYWVVNGHHFNNGCCYDYGNAETDSRDDGDGTMETTFFGNTTPWYHGQGNGPWVMTDQENNLVGCVNPSPNDKFCPMLPSVPWRFVTAMADGEPHHWRSMGGDAQRGALEIMYDGSRVTNDRSSYDPMRKQGAILLGNGGDNSNGSQGTFYEGAMTAAGSFPTKEVNQKVQANVVAARYDVQRLSLAPANAVNTPPGIQTFSPGSSQNCTVTFVNTTGGPVKDVVLSIVAPKGWRSEVLNAGGGSKKFSDEIAPGGTVSATFRVSSGMEAYNGDLRGSVSWKGLAVAETTAEKVRNVSPVKINEFRVSDGSMENHSNSFVELYNAGEKEVDLSNWDFVLHATQMPVFSSVKIPAGTRLAAHSYYLLGLANSGLAVPARKGETMLFVRDLSGMSVGDEVRVGSGAAAETRRIAGVSAVPEPEAAPGAFGRPVIPGSATTIWQPVPDGPVVTIPAGATNVPVASVEGFKVGQKMAIGYGTKYPVVGLGTEKYEVVTITGVGKPGTQAYLSADAKAGSTNIKVSSVANISVGDTIRLDIASKGHGIETVTVKKVGTASSRGPGRGPFAAGEDVGTGLDLAAPLKFDHSANIPFSVRGTGISYEPATAFAHSSNEPVLPLVFSITLDRPLANSWGIDEVVRDEKVKTAGYQGVRKPDQWFGGPALAAGAGSMALRDAQGNLVDGLNYGGLVDPWMAEGYQAVSGTGANGSYAPSPGMGRGFRPGSLGEQPDRSAGRYPDGYDNDDNGHDFFVQHTMALALGAEAGTNNVKVTGTANFTIGQPCIVGLGANAETATIAVIGTAGGTMLQAGVDAGATDLAVAGVAGFEVGQKIMVGDEAAVVASVVVRRRGYGNRNNSTDSIVINTPLKQAHAAGTEVSGSGIIFARPLTRAHASGTPIASNLPTPGEPNQYIRK
ncbi:MAG: lamin tail domain-containing protein [Bacteroidetes bacterium]|nr:lamin tail domain-containing protein [Bacteroidota bacterium]